MSLLSKQNLIIICIGLFTNIIYPMNPWVTRISELNGPIQQHIVYLALFSQPRPLASWIMACNAQKSVPRTCFETSDNQGHCSYGKSSIRLNDHHHAINCINYYGDYMACNSDGMFDHYEQGDASYEPVQLNHFLGCEGTVSNKTRIDKQRCVIATNLEIPFTYPLFIPTSKNIGINRKNIVDEDIYVCQNTILYKIIEEEEKVTTLKLVELKPDIFHILTQQSIPSLLLLGKIRNKAHAKKCFNIAANTLAMKIYMALPDDIKRAIRDHVNLPIMSKIMQSIHLDLPPCIVM